MLELDLVKSKLLAYPIHVFYDGAGCQTAVTHQRGARPAIKLGALSAFLNWLDNYIFAPGTRDDILQVEPEANLAVFNSQCQTPLRQLLVEGVLINRVLKCLQIYFVLVFVIYLRFLPKIYSQKSIVESARITNLLGFLIEGQLNRSHNLLIVKHLFFSLIVVKVTLKVVGVL